MSKQRLLLFAILIVLITGCTPEIPEISGIAYYIDCESGDDANLGTSSSNAWRSLENLNAKTFQPGDGIFFRRGTICQGALIPNGSGSEGQPITISAYGRGELPVIDGADHPETVKLVGQEYWEIRDIEVMGGTRFGLLVSGRQGVETLHHIRLSGLVVHDIWGEPFDDKSPGLVVVLSNGSIFKDVIIDGVTAYNTNQWAGIEVNGAPWPIDFDDPRLSEDIIIRNSTVHNVYGDGIVLWGVRRGLIEYSVAYDTGQQPSPQTVGTPSSIWTWSCYDCVVQFNESYNASSPEIDAGCYDIDWGTRNNIFQYNYGHDCDGYCLSVFGAGGVTTVNAIARYNVCAHNGRKGSLASRQGDFFLSTWGGGDLDGVLIYNNTSYWDPGGNYPALVNGAEFSGNRPNIFANNMVVSTVPWLVDGGSSLKLDHNLYWIDGPGVPFFYFDQAYYTGFAEYQNLSGHGANSIFADPLLNDVQYHQVGAPQQAFTLQTGSPAIDAGLDLGSMGSRDFFGNLIPYGKTYDIGANEWSPKKGGITFTPGLATSIGSLYPLATETGFLLLGLVDPNDQASRSQVVFLRSMARQFSGSGLHLVLVDVSGLTGEERTNLAASWHLGDIPLLSRSLEITTPSTFLFDQGSLLFEWNGLHLPFDLSMKLKEAIP